MEENQTIEEKTTVIKEECPICDKHPMLKSLLAGLLIFLGAYCAFYTVVDWHMKRMAQRQFIPFNPAIENKMFNKEMHSMDKMFAKADRNPFARKYNTNIIHMEQEDDEYKIYIDLKSVDNDANNIQVNSNGNILTISGKTIKKGKNNEQISEFQQNYMFGDNVKLSELKKEIEGNVYVIKIPITNTIED